MRRDLLRALRALFLPTVAVAVVVGILPGRFEEALRVYVLLVCGLLLAVALAALRRAYPPVRPLRGVPRRKDEQRRPPGSLARLEDEAALGVAGAFDLHHRFRPHLRRIAAEILAGRRLVSLDSSPDEARKLLGEDTWELIRADHPPPEDRLARGIPVAELRRTVEALERV
jgi:hypothetical protein